MLAMHDLLTEEHIVSYARDGAVFIKGLFADHVEDIKKGIALNMANPSEYAAENLKPGEAGRFFDDYCNWSRILPFQDVITHSPVG